MLTIATEDADQTADVVEVVPLLVSSLVAVVVASVALALADIRLGLLVVVGTVAILSVLSVMSRRIGASTREQQARVARAGAKVADLISGLRPLHGFGGNHAAFLSYRKVSTEARRQAITVAKVNGVYAGTALALNAVLAAAVTLTAGWLAYGGSVTIGELVMAVGLAQFIMEPLKMFSEMPKYVMMARASAERMALVLAAPPVTAPGRDSPAPGGDLEVDGVSYGSLRELTFRVRAGEFVAVAPYQPRAAADLASVLAANVPPRTYGGVVRVSGREMAELSVEALREHMLVNPYDAEIFMRQPPDEHRPVGYQPYGPRGRGGVAPDRCRRPAPRGSRPRGTRPRGEPLRGPAPEAVAGPRPRRRLRRPGAARPDDGGRRGHRAADRA